jgi:hypothetical protein
MKPFIGLALAIACALSLTACSFGVGGGISPNAPGQNAAGPYSHHRR